jgi:hypothetical protein
MSNNSALEAEVSSLVIDASTEYVGRWNRLVSTTNWEKGRIIVQWREALQKAGAAAVDCTDEAWAEQVGGVSPQHVGRLRRVYERFADSCQEYPGLYWSHFYTALDWPDAEMWLEGAVQNGWSIAQMRNRRWETLGAKPGLEPRDSDIILSEGDDDGVPDGDQSLPGTITETLGEVHDVGTRTGQLSDSAPFDSDKASVADSAAFNRAESAKTFRPFENLPPMPADVSEAFELFKLAIVSRKLSGWSDITLEDVLSILDALKQMALAPAE